jgi:hypothetical protein
MKEGIALSRYLSDPLRQSGRMKNPMAFANRFELLVATFGRGRLVRIPDGRYELRGGSTIDLWEAREWASLFMPEAVVGVASYHCKRPRR